MHLSDAETGEEWEISAEKRCCFRKPWYRPYLTWMESIALLAGHPLEMELLLSSTEGSV